ncbi:MAG: hypothetical protein K0U20_09790 [Proteobacteria bacterium]|nr:hypothetical protein [Pseudomonadota bacterium]
MKLFALNQQAKHEQHTQMLDAFAARSQSIQDAREQSNKESPMAALNRRVIIFVILGLVIFTQVAPVLLDVPTVVPTVQKGISFLGFDITSDKVYYVTLVCLINIVVVFKCDSMLFVLLLVANFYIFILF